MPGPSNGRASPAPASVSSTPARSGASRPVSTANPPARGNGGGMEFALTGVVHHAHPAAPAPPERHRDGGGETGADQRERINIVRKGHPSIYHFERTLLILNSNLGAFPE